MFLIIRICSLGILGFMFPRILVAAGMPLDEWAQTIGMSIAGAKAMTKEMAINFVGIVFALVLITAELWWKPVGNLISRLQGGNKQPSQHIHHYHGCTIYQNADGTRKAEIQEKDGGGKNKTYIKLDLQTFFKEGTFPESSNISSVSDDGIGLFTFTFTKEIDPNYVVKIDSDKTVNFEVTSKSSSGATIKFLGDEPGLITVEFA
jgi:hypothetical protein